MPLDERRSPARAGDEQRGPEDNAPGGHGEADGQQEREQPREHEPVHLRPRAGVEGDDLVGEVERDRGRCRPATGSSHSASRPGTRSHGAGPNASHATINAAPAPASALAHHGRTNAGASASAQVAAPAATAAGDSSLSTRDGHRDRRQCKEQRGSTHSASSGSAAPRTWRRSSPRRTTATGTPARRKPEQRRLRRRGAPAGVTRCVDPHD